MKRVLGIGLMVSLVSPTMLFGMGTLTTATVQKQAIAHIDQALEHLRAVDFRSPLRFYRGAVAIGVVVVVGSGFIAWRQHRKTEANRIALEAEKAKQALLTAELQRKLAELKKAEVLSRAAALLAKKYNEVVLKAEKAKLAKEQLEILTEISGKELQARHDAAELLKKVASLRGHISQLETANRSLTSDSKKNTKLLKAHTSAYCVLHDGFTALSKSGRLRSSPE